MKTLSKLSNEKKIELVKRMTQKTPNYRAWEQAKPHARIMIIQARVMMELPHPPNMWFRVLKEWRKKLKDPHYIMQTE